MVGGVLRMVGPVRAAAQDGTTKWLRHLPVTIGSTDVDQPLLSHPGFQGSHDHSQCKAELAVRVIQGRWKLFILRELIDGVRRFSDLQRALTGVSQKVLQRTVYPEVPPRVEYALTALGSELIPVLEGLHAWGERAQGAQMGLETSA